MAPPKIKPATYNNFLNSAMPITSAEMKAYLADDLANTTSMLIKKQKVSVSLGPSEAPSGFTMETGGIQSPTKLIVSSPGVFFLDDALLTGYTQSNVTQTPSDLFDEVVADVLERVNNGYLKPGKLRFKLYRVFSDGSCVLKTSFEREILKKTEKPLCVQDPNFLTNYAKTNNLK